jgi:hypothetical protein
MIPGKPFGGQPGTTWDNLFSEVVPRLDIDNQRLTSTGDTGDNLFESLACEGKKKCSANIHRRSWQKVVPSVPHRCNSLMLYAENGDNLVFEVVPGCPPGGSEVVQ